MTKILWAVPDKVENISIGRSRIKEELQNRGYDVNQFADYATLLKEVHQSNYDVVISSCAAGGFLGPLAKATGKSYIVDYVDPIMQMYHSSTFPKPQLAYLMQAVSFRSADHILYVYDEETLRVSRFGKPTSQTTLGVEFDRFAAATGPYDETLPDKFAVYLGGLEPIYNIEAMVGSAIGNYDLVIAGSGSKSEYVESQSESHPEITYLGNVDHSQIPALLAQADVGISLADDPHTVKVLEYAASGLSIVHAEGRAEQSLPSEIVFTSVEPTEIAEAVSIAMYDRTHPRLQRYAAERDYKHVTDDYEAAIEEVA